MTHSSARRPDAPLDVAACLEVLASVDADRCTVAPSPELSERIQQEVARLEGTKRVRDLTAKVKLAGPSAPGLNDGLIIPGSYFPLGTSLDRVRSAAAERAPIHGTMRVIVVLVDFSDQVMAQTTQHFDDLFFSTGVLPNGSVKEYFHEVSNGLVDIVGQVVGPYRMPRTMAQYANSASGTGAAAPNARTMARDAVVAADPDVNFGPYDNDGNGFVDAFVVVHAGPGAEQTGNTGHIWSHKWVLSGGEYATDSTKIYAYLTVPEDARIGVCAHELGHLLFGLPDLYDTDNTSEGIGNWCLMAGGSWNGGGDVPAHPSAWCKTQQDWVTVHNVASNTTLTIPDVKDNHTVYRLWKDGAPGQEYFLVENRQRTGFDAHLPGDGLLVWHIDDAIANNTNEAHYRVALEQADGARHLENNSNRGDAGDPYPGSSDNRAFTNTSTPNSKSYAGLSTCVSITAISDPGPVMSAQVQVRCGVTRPKYLKDRQKDTLEKPRDKRVEKLQVDKGWGEKRPEKPQIDKAVAYDKGWAEKRVDGKLLDKPNEGGLPGGGAAPYGFDAAPYGSDAALEARVAALEAALYAGAEPFIGAEQRPDLRDSALLDESDQGESGPLGDKHSYDSKPPEAG
jgi:immune inhibitor A